jgi:hypothetical protein
MLVRMSEEDPDYEGKWPEGDAMSERVLVPREPTPEMIRAGWPTAAPDWVVEALYRAMLDAAPAAPQMTDEEMDDAVKRDEAEQERAHIAYLRGIDEGKRQAAAPQQAEPVAQIGWADEFGNLFPMGAWKPAHRTHHDSHKTAWRAVFLHPPAAPQQAEPVAWMKPTRDSCYLRSAETMLAIHEDCDGIVRTGWKPLYLHPPAAEVQRLKQERDGLKNRLEWRHDGGPDGISARDETIKMQDAEVRRLQEALKPFAAIDLTTNQAVDAMDVLRARRALEGK